MDSLTEKIEAICERVERGELAAINATDAILSTLTPDTRFTGADGREMVVVPVEASEAMLRMGTAALSYDDLPPADAAGDPDYTDDLKRQYRAMIAAASEGSS